MTHRRRHRGRRVRAHRARATSTRATSRSSTSTCSSPRSCSCCSSSATERDDTGWSLSAQVKPIPERLRSLWYVRRLPQIGFVVLFGFLAVLPLFLDAAVAGVPVDRDRDLRAGRAVDHAARRLGGPALARAVRVRRPRRADDGRAARRPRHPGAVRPVGHAGAAGVAARPSSSRPRVGVVAALVIGIPALRVRGLFLAVITLAFAVMCSNWLFRQPAWTGSEFGTTTPRIDPPVIGSIDFSNRRSLYYLCLGVLVVDDARRRAAAAHGHRPLDDRGARQRGHGRGVDRLAEPHQGHRRSRVSGGIAALAGCLFITLREQVTPTQAFTPEESLRVVATAVIGGLGSIAGPVLGALWVRGLPVLFNDTAAGAAVHEQHRPADPAHVLPGRAHADRVPAARRGARVGRPPARRSRRRGAGARDREAGADPRRRADVDAARRRRPWLVGARRERALRRQPGRRPRRASRCARASSSG